MSLASLEPGSIFKPECPGASLGCGKRKERLFQSANIVDKSVSHTYNKWDSTRFFVLRRGQSPRRFRPGRCAYECRRRLVRDRRRSHGGRTFHPRLHYRVLRRGRLGRGPGGRGASGAGRRACRLSGRLGSVPVSAPSPSGDHLPGATHRGPAGRARVRLCRPSGRSHPSHTRRRRGRDRLGRQLLAGYRDGGRAKS